MTRASDDFFGSNLYGPIGNSDGANDGGFDSVHAGEI